MSKIHAETQESPNVSDEFWDRPFPECFNTRRLNGHPVPGQNVAQVAALRHHELRLGCRQMQLLLLYCVHEGVNATQMFFKGLAMNESVVEEDCCVIRQQIASRSGIFRYVGVNARYRLQDPTEQSLRDGRARCKALWANAPLKLTETRGEC
jgi:hypothetical protein